MKSLELERIVDKIDIMLDNSKLKSKDEDTLLDVRDVLMKHIVSEVFESKELDKAIKKYKRLI